MAKRMLDLFCGRFGWSRAFAARGWECVGIDLVEPPEIPAGCVFLKRNILEMVALPIGFDFICASSPCEEFSIHGMKHFHPSPKYPDMGIKLFNHTRMLCESSGIPYVMENVRAAQNFVGTAVNHCGSFFLWGNGVPALLPQGVRKGATHMRKGGAYQRRGGIDISMYGDKKMRAATLAVIAPELSFCVADYAERITEREGAA